MKGNKKYLFFFFHAIEYIKTIYKKKEKFHFKCKAVVIQ